jgi:hypothetical protein
LDRRSQSDDHHSFGKTLLRKRCPKNHYCLGRKGRDLNDYANRSIAGLMKDFYGERWKIFIDEAINAVEQGKTLDEKP